MTIGMLIESLTGKAGALTGQFVDASPFQSSDAAAEGREAVDQPERFGAMLEEAGFTRNGGEVRRVCCLVCSLTGVEWIVGGEGFHLQAALRLLGGSTSSPPPRLLQVMISGVTGEPFPVDIYIGVVYYQRLRHMVSDKFQVGACAAGCWRCWMLGAGCWVLGAGCWVLGAGCCGPRGSCTRVLCKHGSKGICENIC